MYLFSCISICSYICFFHATTLLAFNDYLYFDENGELEGGNYKSWNGSLAVEDVGSVSRVTRIYAYSRGSGDSYTEIVYRNISTFFESGFDVNKTTKVLIHGWRGSAFSTFATELRHTYQSTQDVNILVVDWSKYADGVYSIARYAVVPVGKFLAEVVDWLETEAGVSVSSIHIIGHSLGAHIGGAVGEHVTGGDLGRISGLDPAGPGFLITSTSGRLDSSDAEFVDVIHTCGGVFGYYDPCGHVDFYPNKGTPPQPGCTAPILICAHVRSHVLYNESISSEGFVSTLCDDWEQYRKGDCASNLTVTMGEHVDTSARGKFYLRTASHYPYALGNVTALQDEEHQSNVQNDIEGVSCKEGLCDADDALYKTFLQQSASSYTNLYLFTRETGEDYTEIIYENLTSVTSSAFDVNKITKVIVHGWLVSAFKSFEQELRESYLAAQDVNVVAVDWSAVADQLYVRARMGVAPVGKFLALVLDWLVLEAGLSVDRVHIVGHSLGAHIAGMAGEHITVGNLSRITGLDPAGPGFTSSTTSGRLDSSDAQFVDVIHTCGHWAGYYDPCGHVDFYPNKGTPPQPGCTAPILICSHGRSHEFLNESVSSEGFVSRACDSWSHFTKGKCDDNITTVMGEHVDTSARGMFFLRTDSSYPYALGNISSKHYDKRTTWMN